MHVPDFALFVALVAIAATGVDPPGDVSIAPKKRNTTPVDRRREYSRFFMDYE